MGTFKFVSLHGMSLLKEIPLVDGKSLTVRELLVNHNVPLDFNLTRINKSECKNLDRIICDGDLITCCSTRLR